MRFPVLKTIDCNEMPWSHHVVPRTVQKEELVVGAATSILSIVLSMVSLLLCVILFVFLMCVIL